MEIPFGPKDLALSLGSLYKRYGGKIQGYSDEITQLDYKVAAAVLQISHCNLDVWSNNGVEVACITGEIWDRYIVSYQQDYVFIIQESLDGFLICFRNYDSIWIDNVVREAQRLVLTFGRM